MAAPTRAEPTLGVQKLAASGAIQSVGPSAFSCRGKKKVFPTKLSATKPTKKPNFSQRVRAT